MLCRVVDNEPNEYQMTNPNVSARARRRERSMRTDTPRSSYDEIIKIHLEPKRKGSANSERAASAKSDRSDRSRGSSASAEQEPKKNIKMRQASLADDEEEESSSFDTDEDRDRKREEKEVENFEMMLDATLHIAPELEKDTVEMEEVATPPKPIHHVQSEPVIGEPPVFSKETLNSSGRLMERIVALRKDCLNAVGLPKLHKAYQILDDIDSDNMEARLKEHLGEKLFEDYAGKIWQLKFCEESAFRIN